jgi:hypothetical protein
MKHSVKITFDSPHEAHEFINLLEGAGLGVDGQRLN